MLDVLPGPCSHPGAAAAEGHMRGVGREPRQDAVGIPVRERVDLDGVVGARRHQLPVLWMTGWSVPSTGSLVCPQACPPFHPPSGRASTPFPPP